MTPQQILILAVLAGALALFMWGRWRYDLVALGALIAAVLLGLVPAEEAFLGFGHPAVITVAVVLVLSRAMELSGVVDLIAGRLGGLLRNAWSGRLTLTVLVTSLSGFMNDIAALALILPLAVGTARRRQWNLSCLMMPLAFGSLLGGLLTKIGTPPNIIVANYRTEVAGEPFAMFDFTLVGLGIAVAGVLFMGLVGWRLLPSQRTSETDPHGAFSVQDYVTEARVTPESPYVGREIGRFVEDESVNVIALVRGDDRRPAPPLWERLQADDVLVIEGDPVSVKQMIETAKLVLVPHDKFPLDRLSGGDVVLMEAVVPPGSLIVGRSAKNLHLGTRHGVNLLGVSRRGRQVVHDRLETLRFGVGDVLLLQGDRTNLAETIAGFGCLPLAEHGMRLGQPHRAVMAVSIFGAGIAAATLGLAPIEVALAAAALGVILVGLIAVREIYEAIDWPIIVLLGAMIPVGDALNRTGADALLAGLIVQFVGQAPVWAGLAVVMAVTSLLTNVINNAACAVIMAPIAAGVAEGLGVSADPYLMGVAVCASAAFLTPIGHQSNVLVMGPGGYRFSDYLRLGLPLTVVTIAVGVPVILAVWPP